MPEVKLLNIGSTIEVPDGQTVLSAAIAAGIDYPHGCKSGRCGSCKSRIAAGEVEHLEHSRFALSLDERENGLGLACRAVPKGPVAVAWLDGEDNVAEHPVRELEAEVVAIEDLTHDVRGLRLKLDGPALRFSAGQYATLSLPGIPTRDYSMANAPGAEELEFQLRRVPKGGTSAAIHDRLQVGDRLRITGPRGSAHLRTWHTGPILAVAGGSGLAPILSILESAVAHGMRQPVCVYVGGKDERDLYALDRLADIAWRHRNMTVTPVLSSLSSPTDRRSGFVHAVVRADLHDLTGWKCYAAGSPRMIDALAETVFQMGLERANYHADVFFTPEATPRTGETAAAS